MLIDKIILTILLVIGIAVAGFFIFVVLPRVTQQQAMREAVAKQREEDMKYREQALEELEETCPSETPDNQQNLQS